MLSIARPSNARQIQHASVKIRDRQVAHLTLFDEAPPGLAWGTMTSVGRLGADGQCSVTLGLGQNLHPLTWGRGERGGGTGSCVSSARCIRLWLTLKQARRSGLVGWFYSIIPPGTGGVIWYLLNGRRSGKKWKSRGGNGVQFCLTRSRFYYYYYSHFFIPH